MSEQEQHAIIGQVVVEHRNAKLHLAMLEARARLWADYLRVVATDLAPGNPSTESNLASALGSYPDRCQIDGLRSQLQTARKRLEALEQSRRDLDIS